MRRKTIVVLCHCFFSIPFRETVIAIHFRTEKKEIMKPAPVSGLNLSYIYLPGGVCV